MDNPFAASATAGKHFSFCNCLWINTSGDIFISVSNLNVGSFGGSWQQRWDSKQQQQRPRPLPQSCVLQRGRSHARRRGSRS